MSRVIRKVEDEDWYIVYCNTVDRILPIMFEDEDIAEIFIAEYDNMTKLSDYIIENHQGILTNDDFIDYSKQLKGGKN